MSDESQYRQLYNSLLHEAEKIHATIQLEIRRGLWGLIGVTVLFLALMFLTKGSKVIFLLLWIVIMFCLAALLMVMEYVNYLIKTTTEKVTQQEHADLDRTLTLPKLELPAMPRILERVVHEQSAAEQPEQSAAEAPETPAAEPRAAESRPERSEEPAPSDESAPEACVEPADAGDFSFIAPAREVVLPEPQPPIDFAFDFTPDEGRAPAAREETEGGAESDGSDGFRMERSAPDAESGAAQARQESAPGEELENVKRGADAK